MRQAGAGDNTIVGGINYTDTGQPQDKRGPRVRRVQCRVSRVQSSIFLSTLITTEQGEQGAKVQCSLLFNPICITLFGTRPRCWIHCYCKHAGDHLGKLQTRN